MRTRDQPRLCHSSDAAATAVARVPSRLLLGVALLAAAGGAGAGASASAGAGAGARPPGDARAECAAAAAGDADDLALLQTRGPARSRLPVTTEVRGEPGTASFRRFFKNTSSGELISPWHDLPLGTDVGEEKWMVTEIPKMTRPKFEINKAEPHNPIAQDIKNGEVRDYHGPVYWNYGALPRTWEDPSVKHPDLHVKGDNDPVDVVEIGRRAHASGDVVSVKVLGALALIDSGELDWKVIAIDATDPMAAQLNNITDVEAKMHGVVSGIREWFRWYKTPDGKPLNAFGFGERALGQSEALEMVAETHESWKKLRCGGTVANGMWTGSA